MEDILRQHRIEIGYILAEHHNLNVSYCYMVKGDINYLVHEFYYVDDGDEERHAHDKYEECILIFENEKEHQKFRTYVEKNWNKKDDLQMIFGFLIWISYQVIIWMYFKKSIGICRFFEECWKRLEKNRYGKLCNNR